MTQSEPGWDRSHSSAGRGAPRKTLVGRLQDNELTTKRFIDLRDGTKSSYTDHTLSLNQHDVGMLEGEYGVMAGERLVIIDIDSYRVGVGGIPETLEALPDTFTAGTPHGGEHLYFDVEGDVCNATADWGEVRAENQYVVGPGSELNNCDKDWHDCMNPDEGHYEILHDNPIARINAGELRDLLDRSSKNQKTTGEGDDGLEDIPLSKPKDVSKELDFADIEADFDVQARWEALLRSKHGEIIKSIRDGQYQDAGYVADDGTGDRSDAEFVLLEHLGWWMNDDKAVMAEVMNRICLNNPKTDGGRRKWLERDANFRENLLDAASDHTKTYESAIDWPTRYGKNRPLVGGPIRNRVMDALMELGVARTAELVEHSRVDRSKRQVRRALNQLEELDLVNSTRDPMDRRRVLYYLTIYESTLSELIEDRY